MTLPFRRRHHDNESAHDRARTLVGAEMLEPLTDVDAAWLAGHLASCPECRVDRDAYLADRSLLRTLRETPPEPPRDLWARTSAAIEAEGARSGRRARRSRRSRRQAPSPGGPRLGNPFRGQAPLGVLSGAVAVLLLVATSLVPGGPFRPGDSRLGALATPLAVEANRLGWVQGREDGLYEVMFANVEQVCPDSRAGCAPLADANHSTITFAVAPQSVVFSPSQEQLVVVSGAEGVDAGTVLVVTVPNAAQIDRPTRTASPAAPSATPSESASPLETSAPSLMSAPTLIASAAPPQAIATGVTVVGDAAYSPDGVWFAFSARPLGAPTGADLYLWKVGDATAQPLTTDGATYFSGWFDGRIVASRLTAGPPAAAGESDAPVETAAPEDNGAPATTEPSPGASTAVPAPVELHPSSFLLDPATLLTTDLVGSDIWLPAIDPTGRFAAYWSGTVALDPSGAGWKPATGRLVLDGWSEPLRAPLASPAPGATSSAEPAPSASEVGPAVSIDTSRTEAPSTEPSAADGTPGPEAAAPPTEAVPNEAPAAVPATEASPESSGGAPSAKPPSQPVGEPQALVVGPMADFQMTFDPTGTRLVIWIADKSDPTVGTLQLIVLDPKAGNIDPSLTPLPGVPAMRGFSIELGRLAWVSPSGQDGAESSVHVLAWSTDTFGEVQTGPASHLFIVR
jgi:hypothetical protein